LPDVNHTRLALVFLLAAPLELHPRMAAAAVLEQVVWLKGALVHGKPELCSTLMMGNFAWEPVVLPS